MFTLLDVSPRNNRCHIYIEHLPIVVVIIVSPILLVQADWPYPMALEGPLDIHAEGLLLGTQEDIVEILRESARIFNIT